MTKKKKTEKICFLITPIGKPDSPIRIRVDQWMKHIYQPALADTYKIIRADLIESPGYITEQILDLIVSADLAIIDLTEFNPNVMYEAAIRHMTEKPYIQIIEQSQSPPFDIKDLRPIVYDVKKIDYFIDLRKKIKKMAKDFKDGKCKIPKLFRDKFDFGKISSDIDKFTESLAKSITSTITPLVKENSTQVKKIVQIRGNELNSYASIGTVSSLPYTAVITCPNCGFKSVLENNFYGMLYGGGGGGGISGSYGGNGGISLNSKLYKCENCGNHFYE